MRQINKPKRKLDGGFSILELVAVLTISTIIFAAIYVVLSMWSLRFQQLSQIARLQDEAYDCMMKIKHGLVIKQDNNPSRQFLGLLNANSLAVSGNSVTYQTMGGGYVSGYTGLTFKPPRNHPTQSNNDEIKISLNNRSVMYDGLVFGIDSNQSRNVPLFPDEHSARTGKMFVEDLVFAVTDDIINHDEQDLKVVRVILKAGIKLSDGPRDIFQPYPDPYFVEYETIIAIEQGVQ